MGMFDKLMDYVQSEDRICPNPLKWDELWMMLPCREHKDSCSSALEPLLLCRWSISSDGEKQSRLKLQLEHAKAHEYLEPIADFLYGLKQEDWHYGEG